MAQTVDSSGTRAVVLVPDPAQAGGRSTAADSGLIAWIPDNGRFLWDTAPLMRQANLLMVMHLENSHMRVLPTTAIKFPIGQNPELAQAFQNSAYSLDRWQDIADTLCLTLDTFLKGEGVQAKAVFSGLDQFDIYFDVGMEMAAPAPKTPKRQMKGAFSIWL